MGGFEESNHAHRTRDPSYETCPPGDAPWHVADAGCNQDNAGWTASTHAHEAFCDSGGKSNAGNQWQSGVCLGVGEVDRSCDPAKRWSIALEVDDTNHPDRGFAVCEWAPHRSCREPPTPPRAFEGASP